MRVHPLAIVILFGILFYLFYKHVLSKFKLPKLNAITFINGGVKCGKSALSVYFAVRAYKRKHFLWSIFRYINKDIEEPLLYSNIPLGCPYVQLTYDMATRIERFNYGSVVLIDEASLFADSRLSVDDPKSNIALQKFVKLFGHETHGGLMIVNSQSIDDMHVAFRRGLSQYFYVHHMTNWIPFFSIAYVRECVYSSDGSIHNNVTEDLEKELQRIIVPKRYRKYYDKFCFSVETDGLPHKHKPIKVKSLKATKLVSLRSSFNTNFEKEIKK